MVDFFVMSPKQSKAYTLSLLSLTPPHPTAREFPRKQMMSLDRKFCLRYLIVIEIEMLYLTFQTSRNYYSRNYLYITV